jgi:hypothetical protein
MKNIRFYVVAIFSMAFFLAAFYVKTDSSSARRALPAISPSPTPLNTPVPTFTPPVPTFDYVQLASHYLTPLPTSTAIIPAWTPTSTPENLLSGILVRKPGNLTPPPLYAGSPGFSMPGFPVPPESKKQIQVYFQAVTDLINFTNADPQLYARTIESWRPKDRSSMIGDAWILKNDFDNDGQSEWLVSTPVFFENPQVYCCGQLLIFFEKGDNGFVPVHYDWKFEHNDITKVLLVNDLNHDGYLEIVFKSVSCGTACGQTLTVATWDGRKWTDRYIQSVLTSLISFVDRDADGKTEVILEYRTIYKLDTLYPQRQAIDVYGWKNGRLVLLEENRQSTTDPYGILRDIYSAILFGKIDEALTLAAPVIDNFEQKCEQKETYIGIEAMLAYGFQNDPKAMQSVFSEIMTHCNQPRNGFMHAANVFWQAYQKVHDPVLACAAMKRFIVEQSPVHNKNPSLQFFDATVYFPGNYYNFCPSPRQ